MTKCPWCGEEIPLSEYEHHYDVCPRRSGKETVPFRPITHEAPYPRELPDLQTAKRLIEEVLPKFDKDVVYSATNVIIAVFGVLWLDNTLIPSAKNALWQDFVSSWNRNAIVTNAEAERLIQLRFR